MIWVMMKAARKKALAALIRGPKYHISIRILHSGSRPSMRGIPEIMVCRLARFRYHSIKYHILCPVPSTMVGRILLFMRSFRVLLIPLRASSRGSPAPRRRAPRRPGQRGQRGRAFRKSFHALTTGPQGTTKKCKMVVYSIL